METRKFRPIKIEQRAHIDGFVSVIDAMTVRQKYWEECGELLKMPHRKGRVNGMKFLDYLFMVKSRDISTAILKC